MTKFTNFLGTTINEYKAVILDKKIIDTINFRKYSEFEVKELSNATYPPSEKVYLKYIEIVNTLAKQMKCKPQQVELFLFSFLGKIYLNYKVNNVMILIKCFNSY